MGLKPAAVADECNRALPRFPQTTLVKRLLFLVDIVEMELGQQV